MAAVDFERVTLRLKEQILSKRSHGQRELLELMARLELECELPEGQEWHPDAPQTHRPAGGLRDPGASRSEAAMASR